MKNLKEMSDKELSDALAKIRIRRKSWEGKKKKKRKIALPRLDISDDIAQQILDKLEGGLNDKI
jgi:hypothetical protein